MDDLKSKKVVMVIAANDFRDEELQVPYNAFKKEGLEVTIASSTLKPARGMLGAVVTPQLLYSKIDPNDYDAVVFVGGSGAAEYWDDHKAQTIARKAVIDRKVLGAICIAPVTLANASVLKGKSATVWPSEGARLTAAGASYTKSGVEVDGNIVTADGPKSAKGFAEAIIKLLKK